MCGRVGDSSRRRLVIFKWISVRPLVTGAGWDGWGWESTALDIMRFPRRRVWCEYRGIVP
jgi:hypothetical protein